MGHRQLALAFGALTAVIVLAIAVVRMKMNFDNTISVTLTVLVYVGASAVMLLAAKKKWELGYLNALVMLISSSLICSLIYAFAYSYVQDAFEPTHWRSGYSTFGGLFFANFIVRIPIDAIIAIFQKR